MQNYRMSKMWFVNLPEMTSSDSCLVPSWKWWMCCLGRDSKPRCGFANHDLALHLNQSRAHCCAGVRILLSAGDAIEPTQNMSQWHSRRDGKCKVDQDRGKKGGVGERHTFELVNFYQIMVAVEGGEYGLEWQCGVGFDTFLPMLFLVPNLLLQTICPAEAKKHKLHPDAIRTLLFTSCLNQHIMLQHVPCSRTLNNKVMHICIWFF